MAPAPRATVRAAKALPPSARRRSPASRRRTCVDSSRIFARACAARTGGRPWGTDARRERGHAARRRRLTAVAKYVASLPKTRSNRATKFDARNGNNLYQGKCGACHGGRAEGNESLAAPRLAGLDTAYLQRQLSHFARACAARIRHDKYGRQMSLMAPMIAAERDIAGRDRLHPDGRLHALIMRRRQADGARAACCTGARSVRCRGGRRRARTRAASPDFN